MNLILHHIGIATHDLQKSILAFSNLGYKSENIIVDPIQNVKICFLEKEDSPLLELVSSIYNEGPVNNIVSKVGTTAYHFCYLTDNIENTINEFKKQKFKLIVKPVIAIAFNNRKICFMHNQSTGLIEFLEK